MRYAIVIEESKTGYGAYVPDLPGCIAAGETIEETERLIREAIDFHLDGLREEGVPFPAPTTRTDYVEVAQVTAASRGAETCFDCNLLI